MKHLRSPRWLAALLLPCMLLVACGGSDGAGGNTGGSGSEVAQGEFDTTATLRYGHFAPVSNFDPHKSVQGNDVPILGLVYDSLLRLDASGELQPGIAEDWEISPEGNAVTLTLRSGVTFHDGTALDAAAVKQNIDRQLTIADAAWKNDLSAIQSVDVVDPTTVRLNVTGSGAALLQVLTDRAGMMVSPAAFDLPNLSLMPVGAGPYRVTEHQPGNRVVLEKFADYYDPELAKAARIEVTILSDATTRFSALRSGQIDAATLTSEQLTQAEQAGLQVDQATGLAQTMIALNRARPGLDNAAVRLAINYAIDRKGLISALRDGLGEPASQLFPESYAFYTPKLPPDHFAFDPDKARSLLKEAGMATGVSFEAQAQQSDLPMAEAIQAQLADVGIQMEIRVVDPSQYNAVYAVAKETDASIATVSGLPDPGQRIAQFFSSTGFLNPGQVSTPEIDQLISEARAANDQEERVRLFRQVSEMAADEGMHIPLFHPVNLLGRQSEVAGAEFTLFGQPNLRGAGVVSAEG